MRIKWGEIGIILTVCLILRDVQAVVDYFLCHQVLLTQCLKGYSKQPLSLHFPCQCLTSPLY